MGPKALQFIHAVARKLLAKPAKPGEGIISIGNRMQAEAKAGEIAETFRLSGLTPDKWDDFIKSEADVKKYLNIIESMKEQSITRKFGKTTDERFDALAKHLEKRDTLFGPEKADVFELAGKKIDTSKPILGGKNVPETDIVTESIILIKSKKPIDAMAEANSVIGRKGKYKNLTKEQSKKILKDTEDHIFERDIKYDEFGEIIKPDSEDFAHGGRSGSGLNYLLGEDDQNSRVPYGKGKLVDVARRKFLQWAGAGAAGTAAAKSGLLSIFKGGATKSVIKDLTSVPIKSGVDGMPVWFKPLVNKVIKEGDDVTKKFATADREIVHQVSLEGKIGKDALGVDDVRVTQNLDEGTISVQYNSPNTIGESGVELIYKKGEVIPTKKGSVKTKDEFTAVEDDFYPQRTSPDGDFDLEFTENIVNKVDDLYSDTSKLKQFATGKNLTIKEISESMKKKNILKEIDKNPNDHAFRNMPDEPYASGGRVPLFGGGAAKKLWQEFIEKLFLKTSNEIRQGKGIWQGLNQEQWIKQHDNLTKKLKEWEMGGKKSLPKDMKEYFGMNDIQIANKFKIETGQIQASKPVKTLEGIQKTGTIDISDPGIADEFSRFMKETDPKGFKELEQKMQLSDFDIKGKKGHASGGRVSLSAGGLAGMLGE